MNNTIFSNKHFGITMFLNIVIAFFITGLLQLSGSLSIYLFYYFPILGLYIIIYYFLFWRFMESNSQKIIFIIINGLLFLISVPIFFGVYFGVFHPLSSLTFEKVDNCQVSGSISVKLSGNENYSILYVDYEKDGKNYLGYGCLSDRYEGEIVNNINPYRFLENGDQFLCGPDQKKGDSYDLTKRVLRERQIRQLRARTRSSFRSRSSSGTKSKTCKETYSFSSVKLPAWICQSREIEHEELVQQQQCYVSYYKDENSSLKASEKREYLRSSSRFMFVRFNEIYFPKVDLVMLIIFTYYPIFISLSMITICFSECFLKYSQKELAVTPNPIIQEQQFPPLQQNNGDNIDAYQQHLKQVQQMEQQQQIQMQQIGYQQQIINPTNGEQVKQYDQQQFL